MTFEAKKHPLPAVVARMKEKPGIYLHIFADGSGSAPFYVDAQGSVWSLKLDRILDDGGWIMDDFKVVGPFDKNSPQV